MSRIVALVAAALVTAGCATGSEPAGPALQQTADKLGSIRSGDLTLELELDPRGEGATWGFTIDGRFALPEEGALPVLDVEYAQRRGDESETVRLVSDGERAVVESRGRRIELDEAAFAQLRGATGGDDGPAAAAQRLRIESWLVDPELSDGPDGTDRIDGELDLVAVANGLAQASAALEGSEPALLDESDAERLREAVDSAEFELLTGEDDRLLRRLALDVSLGVDVPAELREALGDDVVGADLSFLLEIRDPNRPVEVRLP